MTQEATAKAIGKRIRALRGDETQAEFAEKIGVSRAALANYETGRTTPKDLVVWKIANLTGVEPSSIISGAAFSFDDLAALVGAKSQTDGFADLTKEERALIRVLRTCNDETVLLVIGLILREVSSGKINEIAVDALTFEHDVRLLAKVRDDGGRTFRGITRDTLLNLMSELRSKSGS